MPKKASRKRIARMIAEGKVPFNCRHCHAIFANDRDRAHHEKDAHLTPQHPAARAQKEAKAMGRHQHQHTMPRTNVIARIFRKETDDMFLIDYVTPLASQACGKRGCAQYAIPVTGFCEKHDPVCKSILLGRIVKAAKAADAAAQPVAIVRSIAPETPDRRFISAANEGMEDLSNWNHFH